MEPDTPSILDRSFDEGRKPRADNLTSDERRLIDEAIAQGRVRKLPMTEPRHEKPKRNMLGRKSSDIILVCVVLLYTHFL